MRFLLLLILCTVPYAFGDALSFGVLGGAPFNDVTMNGFAPGTAIRSLPKSANFTIGGSMQVNLPVSLRFETDLLYRPYDLNLENSVLGLVGAQVQTRISASQFRIPLLVQYKFGLPVIKPFVEAGVSIDHLANISASTITTISIPPTVLTSPNGIPTAGPGELRTQTHAGVVFGAGVDTKVPFVRVSAELRYTRQGEYFRSFSNVDQGEFLLGIHF